VVGEECEEEADGGTVRESQSSKVDYCAQFPRFWPKVVQSSIESRKSQGFLAHTTDGRIREFLAAFYADIPLHTCIDAYI
jgi:hypothetical protein